MKTKKLSIIVGLLLVMGICVYNYYDISTKSHDTVITNPCLIDFSKVIIEDTAPELLNIKQHYYLSHRDINQKGIVPLGPELKFDEPHNRSKI